MELCRPIGKSSEVGMTSCERRFVQSAYISVLQFSPLHCPRSSGGEGWMMRAFIEVL